MHVKRYYHKLSEVNKIILKGSFWILIGNLISKSLLLFSSIIIVKFVDKNVYGTVGIIKSTINMFSVFGGLGLGLTTTKFIAQYKLKDKIKTSRIVGLANFFSITFCIVIGVLFVLLSDKIALQINAPYISDSLKLSAVVLVFSGLNGVQNGILSGFEQFKTISVISIVASIISTILQILGAYFWGLNGIILGFGSNFIILYILNFLYIRKLTSKEYKINIFKKENFKELHVLWNFSLPAVFSGLMISPIVWLTNSFLVNGIHGYSQMADFDIANQWRSTVLFIPLALSQVALPMLASTSNKSDFNKILYKNLLLNAITATLVVLVIILFLPFIIGFYGNSYLTAKYPLVIMMITTVLVAVNNIFGNAIASLNKMWLGFTTNAVWGIVLIVCSYYLVTIQGRGAIGLSVAYLLSYIIHTIFQFILYKIVVRKIFL